MKHFLLLMLCLKLIPVCYAGSILVNKFSKYESTQTENFNALEKNIYKKWHELATSSNKTLVSYYQRNDIRLMIDYENGTVQIEGIDKNGADLKNVLNDVITENDSSNAIINFGDLVLDNIKTKTKFINELIATGTTEAKAKLKIKFNFLSDHIKRRAERVRPLVEKWSLKNQIDSALVMGMIRQESAFNPRAQSIIPAFGLMQIVPKYAGRDVMIQLKGIDAIPSKDDLFDPEKNIMFGTSYIKILNDKFKTVTDDAIQLQDLIIASYNWGPERISKAIRNKRLVLAMPNLQDQINRIAPNETINYLKKVKSFKTEFQSKD